MGDGRRERSERSKERERESKGEGRKDCERQPEESYLLPFDGLAQSISIVLSLLCVLCVTRNNIPFRRSNRYSSIFQVGTWKLGLKLLGLERREVEPDP